MQFVINGEQHFLSFVPEESQWFVFRPTPRGFYLVPVVHDDQVPFVGNVVVNTEDEGPKTIH